MKAKFDAEFESGEKNVKKITQKEVIGRKILHIVKKSFFL